MSRRRFPGVVVFVVVLVGLTSAVPGAHRVGADPAGGSTSTTAPPSTAAPPTVTAEDPTTSTVAPATTTTTAPEPAPPVWLPFLGLGTLGCTVDADPGEPCIPGYHPWPAVDLQLPAGRPVRAAQAGVVAVVEQETDPTRPTASSGLQVTIEYDGERFGLYKHLAETLVRPGQPVGAGQIIGLAGRTAARTYHLHYDEQVDLSRMNEPGNRLPLPSMLGATPGEPLTYPASLGAESWRDAVYGSVLQNEHHGVVPLEVRDAEGLVAALTELGRVGPAPIPAVVLVNGRIVLDGAEPTYEGTTQLRLVGVPGSGAELDGSGRGRLLRVNREVPLEIEGLTLRGGAAVQDGGAVVAAGPVTVVESELIGNVSGGSGGAIAANGPVSLVRTTARGNEAGADGGAVAAAEVAVVTSSVVGNQAGGRGGGVWGDDVVQASAATVSGNQAASGGGIAAGGVTLRHATVVDNEATSGVGTQVEAGRLTSQTSAFGSAGSGAGAGADCAVGSTVSGGHNAEAGSSCGLNHPTDRQQLADLRLGPLRDNGGLTPTHFPLARSPLIDAFDRLGADQVGVIRPLTCDPSSEVDQRGEWVVARDGEIPVGSRWRVYLPRTRSGGCDVGAVEAGFPRHSFRDVPAWAEAAVRWITAVHYEPRLMEGFGSRFRPRAPLTRGQTVRALHRAAGSPVARTEANLTDVAGWVSGAVDWAVEQGIFTGFPDRTFRADASLTRGQMLSVLHRLSGYHGPVPRIDVELPLWLRRAGAWALSFGVMTGYPDGFRSSEPVTRAAFVVALHRMAVDPDVWGDPGRAPIAMPFRA